MKLSFFSSEHVFSAFNKENTIFAAEARIRKIAGSDYFKYQNFFDDFITLEVNRCNELLACGLETHYMPVGREIKVKKNGMIGYIDRVDYNPNDGFLLCDYKTATPKNIKHYIFEKLTKNIPYKMTASIARVKKFIPVREIFIL